MISIKSRRLIPAFLIGTSLVLAAANAFAGAYGIQYWDSITVSVKGQSIPIPTGQLAHKVEGDGKNIKREWAHITTKPGFCNWRVDYVYRDAENNKEYRRIRTKTQNGCDTWAYAPAVQPGKVRRGKACAQLFVNGKYVTQQCHSIF